MTKGQKVTRFQIKSAAQNDTKDLRKENNEMKSETEIFSVNSFRVAIWMLMGQLTFGGVKNPYCARNNCNYNKNTLIKIK